MRVCRLSKSEIVLCSASDLLLPFPIISAIVTLPSPLIFCAFVPRALQVRKRDTGRIYAMKVLQKANIVKRNQVEHTRTERNVLGRIVHPFIVGLNYAFQTSDKLYFVLDYCGA